MIALSVALVAASAAALVGWRWWLDLLRSRDAREAQLDAAAREELRKLERRVSELEMRKLR